MNDLSPCGRFEDEGALKLETGEPLDDHFTTCPDCLRARAKYVRIAGLLSIAIRTESSPKGWEARVLARIDSADHRSAAALGPRWIGGRYRVTRPIGEDTMGVVWAAVDEVTSREVAVKLILAESQALRQRLLREVKAWESLSHPNIIEVLDVCEDEVGNLVIVMPLLRGETLKDLLKRNSRVDVPVAAQIARDVARALAAAHTAMIVHGDLKPANIFLHQEPGTEGLVVKVLNYGIRRDLSTQDSIGTQTGPDVNSPWYMSPEQLGLRRDIDGRSDIWALGVILFEMLSGRRPFRGSSQDVIYHIFTGEIPRIVKFVPNIEPTLDALVEHCLQKNRDRRIPSAEELAKLLNGYTSEDDTPEG